MNFRYLSLRLIRHFMPERLARFLLNRRWIIRPGLESTDPDSAVQKYINTLLSHNITIQGKRILIFGYGGRFSVAVELLKHGAKHIVLCDHFVLLDRLRNQELFPAYEAYLKQEKDEIQPRIEYITLLHGDIRAESIQKQIQKVDIILSNSVYEHLDDVDGITKSLANLTSISGVHLHFVDLRDHYFKYPFEMLKFKESVWKTFLNPTSNLNRFRLNDYHNIFNSYFRSVVVKVLEQDFKEFRKAQVGIQPTFKTGNESIDATTLLYIFASQPK